jgi:hypothetical protein
MPLWHDFHLFCSVVAAFVFKPSHRAIVVFVITVHIGCCLKHHHLAGLVHERKATEHVNPQCLTHSALSSPTRSAPHWPAPAAQPPRAWLPATQHSWRAALRARCPQRGRCSRPSATQRQPMCHTGWPQTCGLGVPISRHGDNHCLPLRRQAASVARLLADTHPPIMCHCQLARPGC